MKQLTRHLGISFVSTARKALGEGTSGANTTSAVQSSDSSASLDPSLSATNTNGAGSTRPDAHPSAHPHTKPVTKDEGAGSPVSFLLSLTNPRAESMIEAFLEEPSRGDTPSIELRPDGSSPTDPDQGAASADMFFLPWALDQNPPVPFPELASWQIANDNNNNNRPREEEEGEEEEEDVDPVLQPAVAALASLHGATTTTNSPPRRRGAGFDAALAGRVFTRANRDLFLQNYFRFTHRHFPLVHRPSFDPAASAPALVLAVLLCGALFAPPRDCVLALRACFPLAEEYVFARLDALVRPREEPRESGRPAERERERETHETLQAALLVHGAQFMMNDPAARSASWPARWPALIGAVRRLGLTSARHAQSSDLGADEVDWRRWVRDEVRIRICNAVFLTDWQQCGVFHMPVLSTFHEMTADMPSLPDLWEAKDAAEFRAAIEANGRGCWRRSASLRDCTDALVAESWSGVDGFPLRNLTCLDHLILSTAIHVMIGSARFVSLLRPCIAVLRRAIDRWEELWHATISQIDDEELRTSGFFRHCGEYSWLGRAFLKRSLAGKDRDSPYFRRIGHDTPKELHDLLLDIYTSLYRKVPSFPVRTSTRDLPNSAFMFKQIIIHKPRNVR
ncbi:hypothetical protein VTH06DRAFT_4742 [Thermothelomyces fergusii]